MLTGTHSRAYDYYDETPPADRRTPRHRVWCCELHAMSWPFSCPDHGDVTAEPRPARPSAAGGNIIPMVGKTVVGGETRTPRTVWCLFCGSHMHVVADCAWAPAHLRAAAA